MHIDIIYYRRHKEDLHLAGCENVDQEHREQFPAWFKNHVRYLGF